MKHKKYPSPKQSRNSSPKQNRKVISSTWLSQSTEFPNSKTTLRHRRQYSDSLTLPKVPVISISEEQDGGDAATKEDNGRRHSDIEPEVDLSLLKSSASADDVQLENKEATHSLSDTSVPTLEDSKSDSKNDDLAHVSDSLPLLLTEDADLLTKLRSMCALVAVDTYFFPLLGKDNDDSSKFYYIQATHITLVNIINEKCVISFSLYRVDSVESNEGEHKNPKGPPKRRMSVTY